ncbi:prepilin peptidase, partial [Escherichia coli]
MRQLIGPGGKKPRLLALADTCRPDKAFTPHPANYNKQPLTMLFDVFQQYPAAMPILATAGGLIIGSFLNVVIWRYP